MAPAADAVTPEQLVADLRALGIGAGANVLVHSSLKSLGYVQGGAVAVVEVLVRAVGPGGTVLVPTLTGGRQYNADNPPVFNPLETACWAGTIPETFRKDGRAKRSLHPTHSVAAIGPAADALIYGHELSQTPCGPETPYLRLARPPYNGRILFMGCNLSVNTTFHGVEELAGLPYHMQRRWCLARLVLPEGERRVLIRLHSYGGPRRDFTAVEPLLEEHGALKRGIVGAARCLLLDTAETIRLVYDLVQRAPEALIAAGEKGKGWGSGQILPED